MTKMLSLAPHVSITNVRSKSMTKPPTRSSLTVRAVYADANDADAPSPEKRAIMNALLAASVSLPVSKPTSTPFSLGIFSTYTSL